MKHLKGTYCHKTFCLLQMLIPTFSKGIKQCFMS
jgi:hypothetical protein